MSKKARPLSKASKKIRKAIRNNPVVTASIVALGGLAAAAVRSPRLRGRTRQLTGSVVNKLRLRKVGEVVGHLNERAAS